MLASILSGSSEGMLLSGQASPSYVVVPAGCKDLVRSMPRAFPTPAGQSPLGHTSSFAGAVSCRGFIFIFSFSPWHQAQTRFHWKQAWTNTFCCLFLSLFWQQKFKNQSLV